MIPLLATALGYAAGCVVAALLDRCYTGAPLLRRGRPPTVEGPALLQWTGTLGYVLARTSGASDAGLPVRYGYLPLVGAGAGWVVAVRATDARQAVLAGLFSLVLLALTATDFERHLLPNRLMYPALLVALAVSGVWPARSALDSLVGGLVALAVMSVILLLSPGFGLGDVKLGLLLGLLVGLANVLMALAIGIVGAGVAAVLMVMARRATLRSTMAYGPYLALGALFGMLAR